MQHKYDSEEYVIRSPKTYVLDKEKINTLEDVINVLMGLGIIVSTHDIDSEPLKEYLREFGK